MTILRERFSQSASQIRHEILSRQGACSQRAVYKQLSRLQKAGTVMKLRGRYSLSFASVLQAVSEMDRMYDQYTSPEYLKRFLPEEGSEYLWKPRYGPSALSFWGNLLLMMLYGVPRCELFLRSTSPMLYLSAVGSVTRFHTEMLSRRQTASLALVAEHDYEDYFPSEIYQVVKVGIGQSHCKRETVHVVDDLILRVVFEPDVRELSPPSGQPQTVAEVLRDGTLLISLTRDQAQAAQYKAEVAAWAERGQSLLEMC